MFGVEYPMEVYYDQRYSSYIYIDDLLEDLQSSGKLFADDAKVYRRIGSPDDRIILQEDIHRLQMWTRNWQLSFNEDQ